MDIFQTSPIIQELRYANGFGFSKSSLVYCNIIDHEPYSIAVTIDKDGIFGVFKAGAIQGQYEFTPKKLKNDLLKEMATTPGVVKKIGDKLTEKVKDHYNKNLD